ncbi:nitroreductase [Sphingomonas sp.]|uniref:nitroreductase family protein n=1 Tax=Sphingomonas sp. TaxID=28214 RepID=UPI00286D7935|nr:nitroreductase [Sphingomonas sp.]
MLNDRSSLLSLLETRRSGRPREMVPPGPSPAELERILTIAARTPDHGKLFPWRFVVVEDGQRDAFAALLRGALPEADPEAGPAHHGKAEEFARQGAALVVLVSAPVAGHKIPEWEQQLSCGAAGKNLLLAAHALGYVGGWLTGWAAYSERVRAAFCGPGERIAGFLFLGSPGAELVERPRAPLATVVRPWVPPAD